MAIINRMVRYAQIKESVRRQEKERMPPNTYPSKVRKMGFERYAMIAPMITGRKTRKVREMKEEKEGLGNTNAATLRLP